MTNRVLFLRYDRCMRFNIHIIIETKRNPFEGTGGPEPLRYNWKGYWSRRINKEHRFGYKAKKDELLIAQCRYHY